MKKIFLISIFMYAYFAQAQSKQCVTVALVGTNIEVYLRETNSTPFILGTSDIFINTGGLVHALSGGGTPVGTDLTSPYNVSGYAVAPNEIALSILDNSGSFSIGTSSVRVAIIPVTGTGTPTNSNFFGSGNYIFQKTSPTSSNLVSLFCPVLPVELLSFTAEKSGENVAVKWESIRERKIEYYIVERSSDAVKFKAINYEKPISKRESDKVAYQFMDEKPDLGINYYRLQTKDLDGVINYSKVASVDFGEKFKAQSFPNPFSRDLSIEIDIEKNIKGEVLVELFDSVGKLILTKQVTASGRRVSLDLSTENLVSGTYILRMKSGRDVWQQKITKH